MIIPQSSDSGIGNVLVSIHTLSESYVYKKVVKNHVEKTLDWFFDREEYTPRQLFAGFERELYVLRNDRMLLCFGGYNEYISAIESAEDILMDRYPLWDYPEIYV